MIGINKHDKGFTVFKTWHGVAQYVQKEKITIQDVETVFDYPLEKVPLYRYNTKGEMVQDVSSHAIVRTDKDIVLADGQGNRFTIESNLAMARRIDEWILAKYPDLFIDSVGTLFNGQTAFINLRAESFQVKGDKSPTITNIAYCNPIGKGSYSTFAHSTRMQCWNTYCIASVQGELNKSLRKFSHTEKAPEKIIKSMVDLSEVFLGLKEHKETMQFLASQPVTTENVLSFLNKFFPLVDAKGEPKKGKGETITKKNREKILAIYESQTSNMEPSTAFSRYGLFQAFTDYIDHEGRKREDTDNASILWDGLTGERSQAKERVFQYLMTA